MPQSTIKTVFALIFNENNEVLLIQEGYEPGYGKWCLPGGHVELNESLETTIIREVKEETGGLSVRPVKLIIQKILTNKEYLGRPERDEKIIEVNIFQCEHQSGKIDKTRLTEELDVAWLNPEEAKNLPLRWPWLKKIF